MLNNNPRNQNPRPERSSSILEAAAGLIRQMRFDRQVGDYLEGDGFFVRAVPDWSSENSMSLQLTWHASEPVSWSGMPVFLLHADQPEVCAVAALDARGRAFIPDLEPGEYRLFSSHIFGRMSAKDEMGATGDGRVTVLPWTDEKGRISRIQIESREEPLRGARILLVSRTRMSHVLGTHTLTLATSPENPGWLVGEETLETDRLAADPEQEFLFCVVPREEG